jgi:hypothetical protein
MPRMATMISLFIRRVDGCFGNMMMMMMMILLMMIMMGIEIIDVVDAGLPPPIVSIGINTESRDSSFNGFEPVITWTPSTMIGDMDIEVCILYLIYIIDLFCNIRST